MHSVGPGVSSQFQGDTFLYNRADATIYQGMHSLCSHSKRRLPQSLQPDP